MQGEVETVVRRMGEEGRGRSEKNMQINIFVYSYYFFKKWRWKYQLPNVMVGRFMWARVDFRDDLYG